MKKLKYPKLEYSYSYEKENADLLKRCKASGWGEGSIIFTCPTTINIYPYEDTLEMTFNGQNHHYSFNVPMHDEVRYEKIYKALSEKMNGDHSSFHPLDVYETHLEIFPDAIKPKSIDYTLMSKEDLIKIIESVTSPQKDNRVYFNSNLIKSEWVKERTFMLFETISGVFKGTVKECTGHRTTNLLLNDEGGDINTLLDVNKDIVRFYIDRNKLKSIYKLQINSFYIIPELTVNSIDIVGSK